MPVFRQHDRASSSETAVTRPIPPLLQNAWPVFANVAMDADGIVRRLDLGGRFDGKPTQSAASALGRIGSSSGSLLVDFSIRPDTVPTFSLSDVLNGTVPIALRELDRMNRGRQIQAPSRGVAARSAEARHLSINNRDIRTMPAYGFIRDGPSAHLDTTPTPGTFHGAGPQALATQADDRPR
ncbi:CHASE2 domain-containing protein (plasmid) [Rhizobium phaseoli]|nr:CHASE2 domain-containing protein [Rhizobium phaseoli]ANL82696.1 CHASE2 domain-containing protein [Rhizobium phaseoli]